MDIQYLVPSLGDDYLIFTRFDFFYPHSQIDKNGFVWVNYLVISGCKDKTTCPAIFKIAFEPMV